MQLLRPLLHMLQDPGSPDIQSSAALKPRHLLLLGVKEEEGHFAEGDVVEGQETQQAFVVDADSIVSPRHEAEQVSAILGTDGINSLGQPMCTIESHEALLKRAEAAEQRCRTLESLIQSGKEDMGLQTDALCQALERAQAAEVCN